jgi:hypothetical protein
MLHSSHITSLANGHDQCDTPTGYHISTYVVHPLQVIDEQLEVGFRLDDSNVFKYAETHEGPKLLLWIDKLSGPVKLGFQLSVRSAAPTAFLQLAWDTSVVDLPVANSYIALSADAATADPDEHTDQLRLRLSRLAYLDIDLNHQLQATPIDAVAGYSELRKTLPAKDTPSNRLLFDCTLAVMLQLGTQHTYRYMSDRWDFKCLRRAHWYTYTAIAGPAYFEVPLLLQGAPLL